MKKIFFALAIFSILTLTVFADSKQEALDTFNNYVNAANTYSEEQSVLRTQTIYEDIEHLILRIVNMIVTIILFHQCRS